MFSHCSPKFAIRNFDISHNKCVTKLRRKSIAVHVRRRDLFKYIDFRRAMSAQFTSQTADALTTITLTNVLVFRFSSGPSLTAMTTTLIVSLIPLILVGPIAGDFADRFDRVLLLSRGHLLRALFTFIAILSAFEQPNIKRFIGYLCFCVLLGLTRILYTARATSLSYLVRRHELVAADSSSLILSVIAGATGAAISFFLAQQMPVVSFIVAGFLQLFAARQYGSIQTVVGGGKLVKKKFGFQGLFAQIRSPKTRFAMAATTNHRFLLGICIASIAVMIDKSFNMQTTGYVAVLGISASGSFIGSITAEWISERFPRRSVTVIAFALAGSAIGAASFFAHPRVALGAVMISAFAFQNLRVRSDATIQANASKTAIGKIFALYDLLYNFAFITGGIIGIAATSMLSYETVLVSACLAYLSLAIVFAKLKDGKILNVEVIATHPAGHSAMHSSQPIRIDQLGPVLI